MKPWLSSISFENSGLLIGLFIALAAIRLVVTLILHKTYLEERTIGIINRIVTILVAVAAFALIITAVDNSPLYVHNSPLSLPVSPNIKP